MTVQAYFFMVGIYHISITDSHRDQACVSTEEVMKKNESIRCGKSAHLHRKSKIQKIRTQIPSEMVLAQSYVLAFFLLSAFFFKF